MLTAAQPPSSSIRVMEAALYNLLGRERLSSDRRRGLSLETSDRALPIFSLTTNDSLATKSYLESARQVGWRRLLRKSGQIGFIDLRSTEAPDGLCFAGVTWGELPKRFFDATDTAKNFAQGEDHYDAKVLESPALNIYALWVSGPRTTFIPYAGAQEIHPMSERDFHRAVVKRLEHLPTEPPQG